MTEIARSLRLSFITNLINFIDLKKLNGFPNKDIILNVINSHDNIPLKIVIVGHVYQKDGNIFFLPRTNNMRDWLFIPDLEA